MLTKDTESSDVALGDLGTGAKGEEEQAPLVIGGPLPSFTSFSDLIFISLFLCLSLFLFLFPLPPSSYLTSLFVFIFIPPPFLFRLLFLFFKISIFLEFLFYFKKN